MQTIMGAPDTLTRRRFLQYAALIGAGGVLGSLAPRMASGVDTGGAGSGKAARLLLTGDVMTGRGVDQVLPHPADPALYEGYVKDARDYVRLAEAANGAIDKPVAFDHVWGDLPALLDELPTAARVLNLETAVTAHDDPWPGKGINYRMHPDNAPVLDAVGADCCVLANNHVLDWREPGLAETLKTLHGHGIATAGAGTDAESAWRPASVALDAERRLLVFAFGLPSSGVPSAWKAQPDAPGVAFLPDLSDRSLDRVAEVIAGHVDAGDVTIASIHWGGNWGYDISADQRRFARALIDEAGVDVVHGHSSHHPKGLEVHSGRLILYGCGDCINDYEGIGGHDPYRPELVAAYLPRIDADGALQGLDVAPFRIARMRLERANREQAAWLRDTLNEHAPARDTRLELAGGTPDHPLLRLAA